MRISIRSHDIIQRLIKKRTGACKRILLVGEKEQTLPLSAVDEPVNNYAIISGQTEFTMEYPTQYFDVVILMNVLHLVSEPENLVEEARRVLKEEGCFISPNVVCGSSRISRVLTVAAILQGDCCYHRWSSMTFRGFIESQGFRIIQSGIITEKVPIQYFVSKKESRELWTRRKNTRRSKRWDKKTHGKNIKRTR